MPGYRRTGSVKLPADVFTVTRSPLANPILSAVAGFISATVCQQILVTGSGISCTHGLLAPRPSPRNGCGYTTRYMLPVDCAIGAAACTDGTGRAVAVSPRVPAAMPCGSAVARALAPPGKRFVSQLR